MTIDYIQSTVILQPLRHLFDQFHSIRLIMQVALCNTGINIHSEDTKFIQFPFVSQVLQTLCTLLEISECTQIVQRRAKCATHTMQENLIRNADPIPDKQFIRRVHCFSFISIV